MDFKQNIIVKLRGGLGNQMFQYAFARYLSIKLTSNVVTDISSFQSGQSIRQSSLNIFHLSKKIQILNLKDKKINKLIEHQNRFIRGISKIYFSYPLHSVLYVKDSFKLLTKKSLLLLSYKRGSIIMDGYWQQYDYIEQIKNTLRQEFEFDTQLLETFSVQNSKILNTIGNLTKVCIHIRRSDYTNRNSIHVNYGQDYYKKALNHLPKLSADTVFLIFSDDIEWCKRSIDFIKGKILYVDNELLKEYSDINNFILMTMCNHFIIPNSTYSWWAAWLSKNETKVVILPSLWLKSKAQPQIFPQNWISL